MVPPGAVREWYLEAGGSLAASEEHARRYHARKLEVESERLRRDPSNADLKKAVSEAQDLVDRPRESHRRYTRRSKVERS